MGGELNRLLDELIAPAAGVPPGGREVPVPVAVSIPNHSLLSTSSPPAVAKLNYSHDGMIDLIVANPGITQNAIALALGYSASWVSLVQSSDAFKARLAERRKELIDPALLMTIEENFKGLAARSLEVLAHKMSKDPDEIPDGLATRVFELTSRAAGYGAKTEVQINTQINMGEHLQDLSKNLVQLLHEKKAEAPAIEIGDSED